MKITSSKKINGSNKRKFTVQAARVGKTKEVIVLQGNYGYGWDDLVEYETSQQREAKQDLRDYRENEKGVQHRLIRRRVPNPNYVAPTDNKDAGTIESSTRNKRKFTVKASESMSDFDIVIYRNHNKVYSGSVYDNKFYDVIRNLCKDKENVRVFRGWLEDYGLSDFEDTSVPELVIDMIIHEWEDATNLDEDFYEEISLYGHQHSDVRFEVFYAKDEVTASTKSNRKFTVKASKSAKKSKIMAGGVYPEYLENTDDLASVLERKLKSATGIDFEVVPESIEYITTRHWVHCEPGWFRMKMMYPIDSREDYEFLEQISPYIGSDTPIIQKVISDETIKTNSYSDIEIEDSDDKERYYDGLTFDYIDDDSYTFTLDEFNEEQDLIGAKVIEKIYAIHDELAQIISDYVVLDEEDYYDEDEDIEESTSIGKRKFTVKASSKSTVCASTDDIDAADIRDALWNAGFSSDSAVEKTRTHLGTEYRIWVGDENIESSIMDALQNAGYNVKFDTMSEGWMYLFITDNHTEPKYLYRVSYGYTSDIVEMDDETSDYGAVVDKLIDDLESSGNTGYLMAVDEAESEYSEDMYIIGGNHGLALIHNGNLNIEPIGWSNEVDVNASTDITASIGRRKPGTSSDAEYYEALASGVADQCNAHWNDTVNRLVDITYDISDTAITFIDGEEIVYIQPIENITPNWDDLSADIDELAGSVIGAMISF